MGALHLFFDGRFWVGIFLREREGRTEGARALFGQEPTDTQLLEWIYAEYSHLRFLPVEDEFPQRVIRNAKKKCVRKSIEKGQSRSQQAMQCALEADKKAKQIDRRKRCKEEEKRRYAKQMEKKKRKRRGG